MKNNCIILLPFNNFFNPEAVPLFEGMDKEHSALLYSTLYLNNLEILQKFREAFDVILCAAVQDEQYLPAEITAGWTISFIDPFNSSELGRMLNEKYFSRYTKSLIINPLSIGYNSTEINKVFELLSIEDDALVIGRSVNDRVSYLGFNKFGIDLIHGIDKPDFDFDKYISVIFKNNYFSTVIETRMLIKDQNNFRELYSELSKKESLSYCSPKIHELFTHLFIEYKELLK